ncbi:hypothetical protein KBY85_14330 [Cyanobium sp. BA5m-10]|uniref:hypothetical protein n=1 Tax=Cyanobium sp. BA5m-10 TaxID=2823705 RepID=UPI0020CEA711|nr:hypothetical protein [Cyanobium sp. BA5m-10]MCP9905303.1 hypothetical protein [Cyanobium sp. BA5m-10]
MFLQKGVTLGAYLSTPACKETSQTSFSNILTSRKDAGRKSKNFAELFSPNKEGSNKVNIIPPVFTKQSAAPSQNLKRQDFE